MSFARHKCMAASAHMAMPAPHLNLHRMSRLHAHPTVRLLYLSMSAAWIMSASADVCRSPNISLSSEKTRLAAAELGVKEPTICIASAHVGNSLPWFAQKLSTSVVNLVTSSWS